MLAGRPDLFNLRLALDPAGRTLTVKRQSRALAAIDTATFAVRELAPTAVANTPPARSGDGFPWLARRRRRPARRRRRNDDGRAATKAGAGYFLRMPGRPEAPPRTGHDELGAGGLAPLVARLSRVSSGLPSRSRGGFPQRALLALSWSRDRSDMHCRRDSQRYVERQGSIST